MIYQGEFSTINVCIYRYAEFANNMIKIESDIDCLDEVLVVYSIQEEAKRYFFWTDQNALRQSPIDYVFIDGHKVIANTRASTALINAGIPKSQWYGVDKTDVAAFDDVTFDDLVRNQLDNNYGGSVDNARR